MGHSKRGCPSLAAAAMAAPAAQPDEELQAFSALEPLSAQQKRLAPVNVNAEEVAELLESCLDSDNGLSGETLAVKPMEELLLGFDEKLKACFRHIGTKSEVIAPVKPISEDTVLKNDEIWNALTDNYGNVMPVDWNQSRARLLHLPTLNIEDGPRVNNVNLDVSDDEEVREQMDMHSIIVSCINEEPLFTAEQVIEEIEEMMQDSPDMEAEHNCHPDLIKRSSSTSHSYEERVRNLSVAELNELLEEVETAVRRYSEELVQQLALRDELDFEKEVKNSFISVLIDVQNRQKEHRELLKKKRKLKNGAGSQHGRMDRLPTSRFSMESISTAIQNGFRQTFGHGGGEKQYLTTVIPYEKKGCPPSVEDLQVLTKILQAMRDDSDKVPSLLTDYILKVLCPT
ncbi:fasciculation and elongation protein zeta-2 isoform X1 [Pygocentrus nattereri]|uniref:Fasciculation and elongation protein zeta 2 n=1 Tax=Pygocentrus nattereri TaxID=42514 RepID=A0A3B4DPQ3_PYGNA|nr:fasciculation and elongation protein zeta-2 isoform X1 [Pygocentrus nattereri]